MMNGETERAVGATEAQLLTFQATPALTRVSERQADADALLSERFLKQRPSCSTR